jgi:hypothetical protein
MLSPKEAGQIAANALEEHVGVTASGEYRRTFEPWYGDIAAPSLARTHSRSEDFAWTTGRLMHVQDPKVLGALGLAAEAGDRRALNLLVEVIKDQYTPCDDRMMALSTLAQFLPGAAGDLAVELMGDPQVNHRLAGALVMRSRSPELLPALEELAMQPDYLSHKGAIEALAEMGEAGGEALAKCIVSIHPQVRRSACNSVMMQKLATPAVLDALKELALHFPTRDDAQLASQTKQWLRGHGFQWKRQDVAKKVLRDLDTLDEPRGPQGSPGHSKIVGAVRARILGEGPEQGLLDWNRDKNQPFTKEERVAQSLVRLAMLRPEIMFELADTRFGELGVVQRLGGFGPGNIAVTRAEQRDARLFVPLSQKLEEDGAFRERVRRVAERLAV